jgi:hypothetical protein
VTHAQNWAIRTQRSTHGCVCNRSTMQAVREGLGRYGGDGWRRAQKKDDERVGG